MCMGQWKLFSLFHSTALKSTIVLLPLLGITWIIGLFAVNENTTVFAWIFTILNSLQVYIIIAEWEERQIIVSQ